MPNPCPYTLLPCSCLHSDSPLRECGLDAARAGDLGAVVVAQWQVDGLGAGVQAGHALAAQRVFAARRRAAEGGGGPRARVGGQREARRRAGGRRVRTQIGRLTVERAAAATLPAGATQAAGARGGRVQARLACQRAMGAAQSRRALA